MASPEAVASAKYEWQRVPTEYVSAPTGRVRIALLGPGKGDWWADRSGSPVDGKLGVILAKIEADAAASAERRRVNEEEFRRRHAEWEQAVAVARERYVQELNERRMDEQVAAWRRAKDIRSYAAQLEDRVDAASDDEAGERTATGLDRSTLADQLDPLARSGQLAWTEPDEIASSELDRFMPRGQSVTRPPT